VSLFPEILRVNLIVSDFKKIKGKGVVLDVAPLNDVQ